MTDTLDGVVAPLVFGMLNAVLLVRVGRLPGEGSFLVRTYGATLLLPAALAILLNVLPILAFTAMLTLAHALKQGNVETAYRQRTQVTMFLFIFMGLGIVERLRRKAAAAQAVADLMPLGTGSMVAAGAAGTIVDHDLVCPREDHDFVYPGDGDPGPRA